MAGEKPKIEKPKYVNLSLHREGMELKVEWDPQNKNFTVGSYEDILKYFKMFYGNKNRFDSILLSRLKFHLTKEDFIKYLGPEFLAEFTSLVEYFDSSFEEIEAFSFKEALLIKNDDLRGAVFDNIDVGVAIQEMGGTRINTAGKAVKYRQYNFEGEYIGDKEYDNVYELYEVDGKKLDVPDKMYAVKCWCTSTNKEHWLWVEPTYKNDPLEAIASTFRIHKNVIPHIKALKRQGDVMLAELDSKVQPEGEVVPLTKEQYFGLLVSET